MRLLALLLVTLSGCTMNFDEFTPVADGAVDGGAKDSAVSDSAATDAGSDACTCVRMGGGKCREWNPPGCGG